MLKSLIKCLYAPNKDSIPGNENNENTTFFEIIFDNSNYMDNDHCVMAGDYKISLNHDIDTNG